MSEEKIPEILLENNYKNSESVKFKVKFKGDDENITKNIQKGESLKLTGIEFSEIDEVKVIINTVENDLVKKKGLFSDEENSINVIDLTPPYITIYYTSRIKIKVDYKPEFDLLSQDVYTRYPLNGTSDKIDYLFVYIGTTLKKMTKLPEADTLYPTWVYDPDGLNVKAEITDGG